MDKKAAVQGKRVRAKRGRSIHQGQKKRRLTKLQIIGALGSLATVAALIWSIVNTPDSGSQNANIQAGDNNQITVNQTKDGDIHNYFGSSGEAFQTSSSLEEIPNEPGPKWLARAYDLVQEGRETGKFDKAKRVIQEMLEASDVDLQTRCILQYNLGLAHGYSGENGAAQIAFQEALKGGNFPDASYCLGLTYVNDESEKSVKDYSKAIEAFTRAIEGEEKPEYYRVRAQVYEEIGHSDEAAQDRESMERLLAARQ